MAEAERLITLKNISTEPVRIGWDGIEYVWEPGEEKTLVYGVGLHCRDNRQASLTVVGESTGIAPETVKVEVQLVNSGSEAVTVGWDGVPYVFKPGEPVTVDQSLAHALMTNARTQIAQNKLSASLELVAPVTDASAPSAEPAPKRKTRKKKKAAEPA